LHPGYFLVPCFFLARYAAQRFLVAAPILFLAAALSFGRFLAGFGRAPSGVTLGALIPSCLRISVIFASI
jgi:hypothetical protein